MPNTAKKFRALCCGITADGKPLHLGSIIRHHEQLMIQSGGFTAANGTGGASIKNFKLKHDRPFLLSMASNGSHFFITTVPTPHLDNEHVVFGQLVAGTAVMREIEISLKPPGDKPSKDVAIVGCGEWTGDKAVLLFDAPNQPDALGDPYEGFPEDEVQRGVTAAKAATAAAPAAEDPLVGRTGGGGPTLSAELILKISTDCKGYGNTAFENRDWSMALDKYYKKLRYLNDDLTDAPGATKAALDQVRISVNSNAALVCLKKGTWQDAYVAATNALGVAGITATAKAKALFRRGQALAKQKDVEGALTDLAEAQKLAPNDANVLRELYQVKVALKARRKKKWTIYRAFFADG